MISIPAALHTIASNSCSHFLFISTHTGVTANTPSPSCPETEQKTKLNGTRRGWSLHKRHQTQGFCAFQQCRHLLLTLQGRKNTQGLPNPVEPKPFPAQAHTDHSWRANKRRFVILRGMNQPQPARYLMEIQARKCGALLPWVVSPLESLLDFT